MTKEYEEINARFDRIRDAARYDEPLPEDLIYRCDVNCYEDLKRLFIGHKVLKNVTKDELFEKGGEYKNAYITEYRGTVLQSRIYKEDHARRMRASRAEIKAKKEKMTCKEAYKTLFFELLPELLPGNEAEKIFENIGYIMWTCGSVELTEEAKKAIKKTILEVAESA